MHWSYQVPSRDQAGKKNGELQNIWLHNQQHLYVVIRQCCRCKVKKYTERKTKVVLISFFKEPNWWFLSKNNFRITVKNIQMLKREGSFTTFCSVSWCGTFLLGIFWHCFNGLQKHAAVYKRSLQTWCLKQTHWYLFSGLLYCVAFGGHCLFYVSPYT